MPSVPADKKVIFEELKTLNSTVSNRRQALVHAYIALARFIAPDDAQLLIQAEKVTFQMGDKILSGAKLTVEEYKLLEQYEEPSIRLNKAIDFSERELIAELAALNSGLSVERTPNGYLLTPL